MSIQHNNNLMIKMTRYGKITPRCNRSILKTKNYSDFCDFKDKSIVLCKSIIVFAVLFFLQKKRSIYFPEICPAEQTTDSPYILLYNWPEIASICSLHSLLHRDLSKKPVITINRPCPFFTFLSQVKSLQFQTL